jgi:uncharacterized protein YwgA
MPLQLTGSWEHALLAATAKAASEMPASGFLGRTALQKIVYFLQVSGVPMRYKFDIYYYGTYCDRIPRDVELLLADGVLQDDSNNREKYSNYRQGEAAEELLHLHKKELEQYRSVIQGVVNALLPLRPERLEVLATLDFLYRQLQAGGGKGPWKERVIDKFVEVKKDKFPRETVVKAYDSMVAIKLIDE